MKYKKSKTRFNKTIKLKHKKNRIGYGLKLRGGRRL